MVFEKITIALELISDSFINPIGKANKKMREFTGQLKNTTNSMKQNSEKLQKNNSIMSALNLGLSLQQIKYNKVGVEMSKIKEHTLDLQNSTRKLTGFQKKQIGILNGEMSVLKQKRQVISSSILKTKGQIMTTQRSTEATKNTMVANMGFFKTMRLNGDQFKELGKRQHLLTKRTGKFAFALRKGLHGMRGFKMEMLGVMFFGMSMTRLFGGLIKTSTSWLGVWELMSMALGILFLPLAKKLMKWAIAFLKWVTKLTPKQKKWINMIVAAGIAIGILLTIVGTLALGLGSLVLAFGFLFSPIGLVITALAAIAGFSFLNNMFSDMGEAVEFAEGKLLSFGVSAESLDMVKEKILGLASGVATMKEEWVAIGTDVAGNLVSGIVTYFKDNPLIIIGAIAGAFLGGPAGAAMGAALGTLFKNLKMDDIPELLDSGLEILDELIRGVINNLDKLAKVAEEFASKLSSFLLDHLGEFFEIGVKIGAAIVRGIVSALGRFATKTLVESAERTRIAAPALVGQTFGPGMGLAFDNFLTKLKITLDSALDIPFRISKEITPAQEEAGVLTRLGDVNITNNFNGFTAEELIKELDERDRNMVAQMERTR